MVLLHKYKIPPTFDILDLLAPFCLLQRFLVSIGIKLFLGPADESFNQGWAAESSTELIFFANNIPRQKKNREKYMPKSKRL
jgi:hypothetical protein